MNKTTKGLVGLVAALVVVNIALVATIWLKKDTTVEPPQRRGDARDYLIKELQLDKGQQAAFDSLRKEHFKRIEQYQRETHFAKGSLFTALRNDENDSVREGIKRTVTKRIGELQAAIDEETFNHFYQLRSILNEGQKQKFDSTIQNILRTLDPRAGSPEGFPPPGIRPDGQQGPPLQGHDGMPPPPNGPPPPQ